MPQTRKFTTDVAAIKQAAAGRWAEIIARLGGIPAEVLDGRHHPCPKCGGKDRFRFVDPDVGSCLCNQCFNRHNGDGIAAVQWLSGETFAGTLKLLADHLGIADVERAGRPDRRADDSLSFRPWSADLAAWWTLGKPGLSVAALEAFGCRRAEYRFSSPSGTARFQVFALPSFGPPLWQAGEPCGWTMWRLAHPRAGDENAASLPRGDGDGIAWVKIKNTAGSRSGLAGPHALAILADAERRKAVHVVWKTAGPSDAMALFGAIPAEHRDTHLVLTNLGGENENPRPAWIELLSGLNVGIVHDCDRPGEAGAKKWAAALAGRAAEVRVVKLPFAVTDNHGKDLRDFLAEGATYQGLLDLAAAAKPVAATSGAIEADDDPHRLARINLERYATIGAGRTLRFWRDEWYTWKDLCYQKIPEKELRAKISAAIKVEFDRINVEKQAAAQEADDDPPVAQKVTMALTTNVMQATASMVCVSAAIENGTVLSTRERKMWVSMANGIIDLEAVLADNDDYRREHTPDWFSTVHLPYAFDPESTCPKWDAFLEHNLEMDPERIKVLQEWAGYCLLPNTDEQKFLVLEGEGNNGKSVYIAGLTAILGRENVSNIPLEIFGDRFSRTETLGKLLNAAGDVGEIDKAAEGFIKAFTSGDLMFFDRKGVAGLSCQPTARLMIGCNNRPRFSDRSDGIWRRMILIPWRVQIERERRIKGMDKVRFWQESGELPGMFVWALRGLDRLRSQGGFTDSEVMKEALRDYQEEMNPAKVYLQTYYEESDGGQVKSSEVYRLYRKWCEENGYHPMSERTFGKEVMRKFPKAERVKRGTREKRYWAYAGMQFCQDEICGESVVNMELF